MSALREILATFTVDTAGANKALAGLDAKLDSAVKTLGALAGAFIGSKLVSGTRELIGGMVEAGSRVNDLSEKLGIGTNELQKFQFAAGLVGIGGEEAAKALQFLNKNVGEALSGNKEASQAFAKLGVNLKDTGGNVRDTSELLPELADKFVGMGSDAERTAMAMKIFGKSGAALLPFLKGGAEGARKMAAEFDRLGGGMTKEFISAADEAGDEIDKLKFALHGWKSQIVFAILPAVTHVSKALQTAVGTLRKITKETNLAKASWVIFGAASTAATAKAAVGWAKLLGVLPKDTSFWKAVLGLGEIALIAGLVALVMLAFEDLFVFLSGGDSVIGDIIDGLFGVGASKDVIVEVQKAFAGFYDELAAFKPLALEIGHLLSEAFVLALPAIKFLAKFLIANLGTSLKLILGLVRLMFSLVGKGLKGFGGLAATIAEKMGSPELVKLATSVAATGLNLEGASGSGAQPDERAHVPQNRLYADAAGDKNIVQTNNVTNNIHGVKDARGAGEAARMGTRDALQAELNDTLVAGDGF